jgi:hypothetical protein
MSRWQFQPARAGRYCDGIGRRNDGTQDKAKRPGEGGNQGVGDDGDHRHRQQYHPDGEQGDGSEVAFQVAQRCSQRCPKKQRRDKNEKDRRRIELQSRQARNQRHAQSPEHQQGRQRSTGAVRQQAQACSGRK